MSRLLYTCFLLVVLCDSCSKDRAPFTPAVNLRLENSTPLTLDSVIVGGTNFGRILPYQLTTYQLIIHPIYAAGFSFKKDTVRTYAGIGACGTPMPAPFSPGFYTFHLIAVDAMGTITVTVSKW